MSEKQQEQTATVRRALRAARRRLVKQIKIARKQYKLIGRVSNCSDLGDAIDQFVLAFRTGSARNQKEIERRATYVECQTGPETDYARAKQKAREGGYPRKPKTDHVIGANLARYHVRGFPDSACRTVAEVL